MIHAVEDEIAAEDLETNKYVCGVKGTYRAGRVVGGEDAVPGEWCHCGALRPGGRGLVNT